MKNTLETRLGLFFAFALLAAVIILEMVGGLDLFRGGLSLKARFLNVQELKLGDPVKIAGKQVGRVDGMEFAEDRLLVTMKITDPKATVRTDSRATIKFSGLMGQNYVAIDFGTEKGVPITTSGQEIATYDQADLSALMNKLDSVAGDIKSITRNFTDLKIDELIAPFADFIKEGRPKIMGVLTNAEAVVAQVANGTGTVHRLIYEDTLHAATLETVTNFNATAVDIRAAVADARAMVADVNAGKGTIGRLAKDEALYQQATEAMTNLKEILQKINQGQGSVGKLVNEETLIDNAKLTLQKLDKATESLEDQGPLTILGILVNPLF